MTCIGEAAHTARFIGALCLTLAALTMAPKPTAAQDRPPAPERGTHLDGLVGVGTTDVHTGPIIGGIVGWRVTGRLAAEARASWLARGTGARAFHADVGGLVNVMNRERLRPFIGAGVGLYRAAFDSSASSMSDFYRRRLGQGLIGNQSTTFVDPAVRLSAGADWRVHDHISIRPEVSAVFVRRNGRGESIAMVGCRIGYRFEERPITP